MTDYENMTEEEREEANLRTEQRILIHQNHVLEELMETHNTRLSEIRRKLIKKLPVMKPEPAGEGQS